MKKILILFLLLFTVGMVSQANAISLSLDSGYYLGTISGAKPNTPEYEEYYINTLIALDPPVDNLLIPTPGLEPPPVPGYTLPEYNFTPSLPEVEADYGYYRDEKNDQGGIKTTVDVSDWTYVLANYDGDAFIWYVDGLEGFVDILFDIDGTGGIKYGSDSLLHISMYTSTAPTITMFETSAAAPVPEPATMLLLGSGLVGLAGFRRKFKK